MTNEAREQEIWKQYPEIPFIEVSSLGRVRTKDRWVLNGKNSKRLVKGRILKQQPLPNGYMQVRFRANGKLVSRYVHRIVAITFIPNPHGYPEINHLDNNPKNNSVSNLEWCTHKQNIAYREKFGVSAAEAVGHSVLAVDMKTNKIFRFKTLSDAGHKLGVNIPDICSVANGKLNTAGGYLFVEDACEISEEKIQEIKAKMRFLGDVIAVNLDTFEVSLFESQTEASRQLGIRQSHISRTIKGEMKKTHGYWFCRVDENTVEKVRVNFGDEMAEKVEKLMSERKII